MRRFLLIFAILFIFVPTAFAADEGAIPSWESFLMDLSRPSGVGVAVGIILSYVAGFIPQFEQLTSAQKRLVFFGACLIIPLWASLLGSLTAGWPWSWSEVYWPAIASGFIAFGAGTALHTRELSDS